MKMNYIFSIALILSFFNVIGQEKLSKAEILSFWKKEDKVYNKGIEAMKDFTFDDSVAGKLRIFDERYDTVGFFVMSEGGIMVDSSSLTPNVYAFWMQDGVTYVEKVAAGSDNRRKRIGEDFFSFYKRNRQEINKECIMPVILGGEKRGTSFVLNQKTSSHVPSYLLYCRIGTDRKTISFTDPDVIDRQSLFYSDNLKSKSYAWFLKTKKEILKLG